MSPADILTNLHSFLDQSVVISCQITAKDIAYQGRHNPNDTRTVRGPRPILKQPINYTVTGRLNSHFCSESNADYLVLEYQGVAPEVIETMRGGVLSHERKPRLRMMHVPFSAIRTIRHANSFTAA